MKDSWNRFLTLWRGLALRQRLVIISGGIITLLLMASIIFYGTQQEYGVLFSDLKPGDAQTIVEKLKTANIPYQLTNGGTAISIPVEHIAETRIQVASAGLLNNRHIGFDIFDRTNFGATDFTQQVNYQRALEGELARTLEGLDEVDSARVHITRAKESVFVDKEEAAKASVVLTLKARGMSPSRAESIVSLVSSAVEGLPPENVQVIDSKGEILAGRKKDDKEKGVEAFQTLFEARHSFEKDMATRLVTLLEPIAGAGHVKADVTAEVDFNQIEQTEEKYDPKSAVARTQQVVQESKQPTPPLPSGIAGTRSNDPNATPTPTPTPTSAGDQRSSTNTNYEIDKMTKKMVGNGARILRLSVSVLLDSDAVTAIRTPEDLTKIQELASAAVGIKPERGDKIVTHKIPFQKPVPAAALGWIYWLTSYPDVVKTAIKYGFLAFVAILLIFLVLRPASRTLTNALLPPPPTPAPLLLPATTESGTANSEAASDTAKPQESKQLEAGNTKELKTAGQALLESASSENADELKKVSEVEKENTGKLEKEKLEPVATTGELAKPRNEPELVKEKPLLTVAQLEEEISKELDKPLDPVKEARANVYKKRLAEQGRNDPEKVALTIRSWLREK